MIPFHVEGMPVPSTTITLYNKQKDLRFSLRDYRRLISFLIFYLDIYTDELIVHFVTEKKICNLHKLLFDDPTPTDCISIPIDPPVQKSSDYHLLGEIFVCPKTAKLYAQKHRLDPEDELLRYVIHGILHLIGYDDITMKDRSLMKKKEEECLKLLTDFLGKH
jgi:probable rRNA maturation factor